MLAEHPGGNSGLAPQGQGRLYVRLYEGGTIIAEPSVGFSGSSQHFSGGKACSKGKTYTVQAWAEKSYGGHNHVSNTAEDSITPTCPDDEC